MRLHRKKHLRLNLKNRGFSGLEEIPAFQSESLCKVSKNQHQTIGYEPFEALMDIMGQEQIIQPSMSR